MTDIFGAPSVFGIKFVDIAIVVLITAIIISTSRIVYRTIKERKQVIDDMKELKKAVEEAEKEKLERFWNVEIPWLGITKWQYTVGFFIMGIISVILAPILLFLIYFT